MPRGRIRLKPTPQYSDRCLKKFRVEGYGGNTPAVYGAYVYPECARLVLYYDGYLGTIEKHKARWVAYPAYANGAGTRTKPLSRAGHDTRADAWKALLDHCHTSAVGRNKLRTVASHMREIRKRQLEAA